jgi:bifunctional N-acetylglucosamine-1-phosphate-uridyltransferase/glucosamine-1-phosphate-acetyltransferase GlmU-like protein
MALMRAASVILAAGKGSRMMGFDGNKTLLPLIPKVDLFTGKRPILEEVIENLPPGPKVVVVNHRKEEVFEATSHLNISYLEQQVTNGTGGAILAAQDFLASTREARVIISMGDVPLIRKSTYMHLLHALDQNAMVVLGFSPRDREQYGALEIMGNRVIRITEWKYWKEYPQDRQESLRVFNAGIYTADRAVLLPYLDKLKMVPHLVEKEREGRKVVVEEFFITDLVELMNGDGLSIGYLLAESEEEVMGVDNPESLRRVQLIYESTGKP